MGRRESPLDGESGPLYEFARALRQLRRTAGQPGYRQLAATTHFSVASLARAAAGKRLPTLEVTLAYVGACNGDLDYWRRQWHRTHVALSARSPVAADARSTVPTGPSGRAEPIPRPRTGTDRGPNPYVGATSASGPRLRPIALPMQLPPPPRGFVGRGAPLALLINLLTTPVDDAPALVAIVGGPGAGKTALAVHAAHQIHARYLDGVLFADLHGFDPVRSPTRSTAVLEAFLRAVGVSPAVIPTDFDECVALWRSIVSGRRLLVILDNAADAAQIRPLLHSGTGSATVITSRAGLSGMVAREGAARIVLAGLPGDEAELLLRRHLAPEQADASPRLLSRMAQLCAGLPLALRVAAERAARHPRDGISALIQQLADERDRLDLLGTDDAAASIRTAFSWSYHNLDPDVATMFRRLGLSPLNVHAVPALTAMTAWSRQRTRSTLDTLAAASLIDEIRPGQYQIHDLLCLYAREQADGEDPSDERAAATRRLFTWYLLAARAATAKLVPNRREVATEAPEPWCVVPTFADYDAALQWCESERGNLVAAVRAARDAGEHRLTWQLAVCMAGFFTIKRYWADWIGTHTIALQATREIGDLSAEATLHSRLGVAYGYLGEFDQCSDHFRRAQAIYSDTADTGAQAVNLLNFGFALWRMGRAEHAVDCFEQCLPMFRQLGDTHGEGMALNNLGEAYTALGRDEGPPLLNAALAVFRTTANRYGEGAALDSIGSAHRRAGQLAEAVDSFGQARQVRREIGDRHGEAWTLCNLAQTLAESGSVDLARGHWREALRIFEELNDPEADRIRQLLTDPTLHDGHPRRVDGAPGPVPSRR